MWNTETNRNAAPWKKAAFSVLIAALIAVLCTGMLLPSDAAKVVKPTKLTIKAAKTTVQVGQTVKVRVTKVKPAKASKSVKWTSSSKTLATVTSKGVVTPLKAGTVTIKATSKYNKKVTAKVKIKITKASSTVTTGVETIDGITIDHTNKTVSFPAVVNGSYLDGSKTMHVSVSRTGTTARWAMLKAQCPYYAVPGAFYEGLISIGGKPWSTGRNYLKAGEKIGDDPSKIANADYSHVNVTLTWPGQTTSVPLEDVLLDDNGNHPQLDMVFSGNQPNQIVSASGCMIYTNSCYYGAISNQANGYSSEGTYHIDAAHFPAADTTVTVTVSLK